MRIAYIGRWSTEPGDGVHAKVSAQVAHWRSKGHEAELFGLPLVAYGRASVGLRSIAASCADTMRLRRAVAAFTPDLVYARYGLFVPPLRPLQRRTTSVVELNANHRAETAVLRHPGRRALHALTGRSLLRECSGLVCVAHEIARDAAALGRPICVIANGAQLVGDVTPPAQSSRPLAAFLAGAPMPWHGVDKLVALARLMPEWDFALIGVERSALPGPAPENVELHPPMPREGYAPLLARADFGVGPLALHRAGLDEASPLKVREYLAHGLPVVLASQDTDFIGAEPWFVHRLANDEDNVRDGAEGVRAFARRVRGQRVAHEEIAALDWRAKEDARLEFFAQLVAGSGR